MKRKQLFISIFVCTLLLSAKMHAQNIYLGFGGGYGFPAAKQSLFDDYKTTSTASGSTTELTAHPFSLGKGFSTGFYIGYMFNKNIGAELGTSYLIGSKNVFTDESTNTIFSNTSKMEQTWKGRMIRLVPTIRMTAGENKIHPYMKTGLIIAIGSKMLTESHTEDSDPSSTTITEENWEYSGGISLGFHGCFGMNYFINDKIGIFAELSGNYQNWSMKKGSMTKRTVNGVDQMNQLDIYDKEIEFVDSYSYSSSSPPNYNQPDKSTKFYLPFSSIGINIGMHISLGGKTE